MIRHLALFTWKPEVTAAQVAELTAALQDMAARLPALRSYECGRNARLRPSEVDYVVSAVVDDADALTAYLDSALHRDVYDRHLGRMIATRAAAQLEVETSA